MRKSKAAAVLLFIYILSLLFGNMSVFAASETEYAACDVKLSSRIWELLFGKENVTTEHSLKSCKGISHNDLVGVSEVRLS